MDVSHLVRSCPRGLAGTSYTGILVLLCTRYCCCCEPEFDLALPLIESLHDVLDSPSTLGARHPSAVASRLGSKRRPRAARAEAARAGR